MLDITLLSTNPSRTSVKFIVEVLWNAANKALLFLSIALPVVHHRHDISVSCLLPHLCSGRDKRHIIIIIMDRRRWGDNPGEMHSSSEPHHAARRAQELRRRAQNSSSSSSNAGAYYYASSNNPRHGDNPTLLGALRRGAMSSLPTASPAASALPTGVTGDYSRNTTTSSSASSLSAHQSPSRLQSLMRLAASQRRQEHQQYQQAMRSNNRSNSARSEPVLAAAWGEMPTTGEGLQQLLMLGSAQRRQQQLQRGRLDDIFLPGSLVISGRGPSTSRGAGTGLATSSTGRVLESSSLDPSYLLWRQQQQRRQRSPVGAVLDNRSAATFSTAASSSSTTAMQRAIRLAAQRHQELQRLQQQHDEIRESSASSTMMMMLDGGDALSAAEQRAVWQERLTSQRVLLELQRRIQQQQQQQDGEASADQNRRVVGDDSSNHHASPSLLISPSRIYPLGATNRDAAPNSSNSRSAMLSSFVLPATSGPGILPAHTVNNNAGGSTRLLLDESRMERGERKRKVADVLDDVVLDKQNQEDDPQNMKRAAVPSVTGNSFPLPSLKSERNFRTSLLASFHSLWSELEDTEMQEEIFRQRIYQGIKIIGKSRSIKQAESANVRYGVP